MGKIFKNMLPYWKWILVIVAFLAMQAFCDLSLPQYTSDIIDVGIMSSGVEHILPEEMTQEDFSILLIILAVIAAFVFVTLYFVDAGYGMLFN